MAACARYDSETASCSAQRLGAAITRKANNSNKVTHAALVVMRPKCFNAGTPEPTLHAELADSTKAYLDAGPLC
jgi:hypothetical protein